MDLCKKVGTYQKDARTSEEFDISYQIDSMLGDVTYFSRPNSFLFLKIHNLYQAYMLQRFDVLFSERQNMANYIIMRQAHKALIVNKLSKLDLTSFYDSEEKLPLSMIR